MKAPLYPTDHQRLAATLRALGEHTACLSGNSERHLGRRDDLSTRFSLAHHRLVAARLMLQEAFQPASSDGIDAAWPVKVPGGDDGPASAPLAND